VSDDEREALRGELAQAEAALALSEKTLAESQDLKAAFEARRAALEAAIGEEDLRIGRLEAEIKTVRQEHAALTFAAADADMSGLQSALDEALAAAKAREDEAARAEGRHAQAREEEMRGRVPAR
jgi:chromosome segregation protein